MGTAAPDPTRTAIETIVREEWGRVLAILVGQVRDFGVAEDVLQDAVVAALQHWPGEGLPRNPGGWLLQTARRKAIDLYRKDTRFKAKRDELALLIGPKIQGKEKTFPKIEKERNRLRVFLLDADAIEGVGESLPAAEIISVRS